MLNGDAHHSNRRDGELRIDRCRVLKDQNDSKNSRTALVDHPFSAMPHLHTNGHSVSAGQIRMLYVGDDLALIRFLRGVFREPEYHVVSCPDRGSAEMFIKSEIRYQLFIFDHEMRHRAAFDLTRLVRSLYHRERLPAIVVGREVGSSLIEFTRASGGDEYVEKFEGFSAVRKVIEQFILSSSENVSGTASRRDAGG